jgi:exo-1,4-beta-D-glucosaminidase
MMRARRWLFATLITTLLAPFAAGSEGLSRIDLRGGWRIQSSAGLGQSGAEISALGFDDHTWFAAAVPFTVIGALVADGLYPDPYFGLNLRDIPGTTYDFGDNFAVDPMPVDSPFTVPWWYRTAFRLPESAPGVHLWLRFDAINCRANVWLNGRRIADSTQVRSMYRRYEFEITEAALAGLNTLAVEVFAPSERDYSISFVDWNPLPADKDMGLVGDVYILRSRAVTLRHPQVVSSLNAAMDQADLTISADLTNAGAQAVSGSLNASIGEIAVSSAVTLAAGETRRVTLTADAFPQLRLKQPGLWWPADLGPQNLYRLHMEFVAEGAVSDRQDFEFGIRQITSQLDNRQHRVFSINGKRILIRGAAWTPDMMLRQDPAREETDIRYARDIHLNAIRLEGKLEMTDHFFEMADRLGVMVMPGWCCCSFFEEWDRWQPDDYTTAGETLRDQLRRLRNHPSVFVFLYGSDNPPNAQAEQMYRSVLQQENWPNPYLASATDVTTAAGRTGVKMTGPYDYVAPGYWLQDTQHGGAFGFITETSPGPAPPLMASLEQMLPTDHLWPIDNFWGFHAGSGSFADTGVFTAALESRYGPAHSVEDYLKKSQAMTYEAERAMFEAYGRNKYTSTGVIQWMLNNAWPGLIWHLYDWYLRPGGGYFGTKKANEPLHVQYSYDDGSVVVVNSLYREFAGYRVEARVYNLDLSEQFSKTAVLDIPEDSASRVFYLPDAAGYSSTYFLRLDLRDGSGNLVSHNFYWLSNTPDITDFNGGDYRYAPIVRYADLTGLQSLPAADVSVSWNSERQGSNEIEHVTVRNPSLQLAFFVHLTVLRGKGGADIAPVLWEDNFFELMPGEEREVSATFAKALLAGVPAYIRADGWNLP